MAYEALLHLASAPPSTSTPPSSGPSPPDVLGSLHFPEHTRPLAPLNCCSSNSFHLECFSPKYPAGCFPQASPWEDRPNHFIYNANLHPHLHPRFPALLFSVALVAIQHHVFYLFILFTVAPYSNLSYLWAGRAVFYTAKSLISINTRRKERRNLKL